VTSVNARATTKVPSSREGIRRHLVLAYRPGWQSLEDLNAIAAHVREHDATIRTFIVPTTHRNGITRREIAERETLVVSPGRIPVFKPLRGKIYQGWPIPKIEELHRLAAAGLRVPRTELITPDLKLDPAEWGEVVVVKPTDIASSSHGLGIRLRRTSHVRYIAPADFPAGHPGRRGPMMVQQFVDTGEKVSAYRVLTFFGEPLSALFQAARESRVALNLDDEILEKSDIAIQTAGANRERRLIEDREIIDIARAAHHALPEIPLKGCDLLRESATGRVYVIELNCGGNTWHFSSNFFAKARGLQPEFAHQRRAQFDAMRTAARILVERTNAEAI
jgi:hypothetical protein